MQLILKPEFTLRKPIENGLVWFLVLSSFSVDHASVLFFVFAARTLLISLGNLNLINLSTLAC